ncbi:MAG: ABC transporter permease [Ferruginibacter sp.]
MFSSLKTEWLKLKNYRAFIIIMIFFTIGIFVANYITYLVNKNIIEKISKTGLMPSYIPYDFNHTWQTTGYVSGWVLLLPAMLIIIIITNEYTYKTVRQNIIDGWSRSRFINAKILIAILMSVFSLLLVIITALGFGVASGTTFSLHGFSHMGFFFLKSLSYNLIAVLLSVLVKRTGFAIGLYFIYLGAENVIAQLLDVWSLRLRAAGKPDFGSMGDYLPMNAADGLLTFPDNPFKQIAKSSLPTDYYYLVLSLALLYIIFFVWLARRKFLYNDL